MAADYTYSTYGGRPANSTSGSTLDWLKFAADIYRSRQDNKVKSVPLTPEQKQILADVQRRISELPNVNPYIARTAISRIGGSAPQLDMTALREGKPNAYTPPRQLSEQELSSILKTNGGTSLTPNQTTPPPSGGSSAGNPFAGGGDEVAPLDGGRGQRLPTVAADRGGGFSSPTVKGYNDPTYADLNRSGPQYTPGQGDPLWRDRSQGQGWQDFAGFVSWLRSQNVQDAAKIAAGFFGGGLTGAALAGAKVWWDRYQASKGGNP